MSMIGKTLAHYDIASPLGKGGMGEVYRAKDQKLGRDVAIKVLPEEFARDPERVGRFEREAKLLASLNHPNIAAIHGLEEAGGTHFLVMELIEGNTLADQLKHGAIPVEESLKLALQIAEALEAAHEKGIIHRDLKLANIKITPDGKVKVLDFGLAKAFAAEQTDLNLSNSPTLSNAATQQGVILGTAAYMSPEQARGKPVDKRADVWAFGVVLFEMLTGRHLFTGESVSDTLAAVLTKDPAWDEIPHAVSPLLHRCLEKDPAKRCRDIGDVKLELEQILANPGGLAMQPAPTIDARTKLRAMFPWLAAALVLGAVITGIAVWRLMQAPAAEPRQVTRFECNLPESLQFGDLQERAIAISPDGSRFVYKTEKGLYLRFMNDWNARIIPGTEGAQKPFFSPDGQWIGFVSEAGKKLKKISINGGPPVPIADIESAGFLSWGTDNAIVYAEILRGIRRISADGGNPQLLFESEGNNYAPQILPDAKTAMYTNISEARYRIMLKSLESGEPKELIADGDTAQYLPTGHIVYASDDNLYAVPFDLKRLRVTGSRVLIVENCQRAGGAPQYAVSDSGALLYMPGIVALAPRTLVWVDRNGTENSLSAPIAAYHNPRISPKDGTKVALEIAGGGIRHIWIWDSTRENKELLTSDDYNNTDPIWSLDGKRIVFRSIREGTMNIIFWKAADGAGETEELFSAATVLPQPHSWSRDGKTLVLTEWSLGSMDVSALSIEGDRAKRKLLQEKYFEGQPQISPDGKWLAYVSNQSGQYEVYIRPFPEVKKWRKPVSIGGGNSPLWSPDSRELFYRNADSVMAVAVEDEPTFRLGKPVRLFPDTYVEWNTSTDLHPWDIHPDGKRFLLMKGSDPAPQQINIVLNWTEELKRRVMPIDD
ncbi:MAG: serine/threonine-protein kinase [Acidobacteria bacterium]|nr:serine/threonine-protein kinase [Acidobacteriota bacterium]